MSSEDPYRWLTVRIANKQGTFMAEWAVAKLSLEIHRSLQAVDELASKDENNSEPWQTLTKHTDTVRRNAHTYAAELRESLDVDSIQARAEVINRHKRDYEQWKVASDNVLYSNQGDQADLSELSKLATEIEIYHDYQSQLTAEQVEGSRVYHVIWGELDDACDGDHSLYQPYGAELVSILQQGPDLWDKCIRDHQRAKRYDVLDCIANFHESRKPESSEVNDSSTRVALAKHKAFERFYRALDIELQSTRN